MKLKKLSFKNFKSYSNIMTEVDFGTTSSLNLIVGENGTGKTSIAECTTYLLYGKIENFTASDIPNRINKNFYGKIEVDCEGHLIIIERGLNPSLFKVEIDGHIIDTAGKNNVQSMLEENYYHIPYTVFHNILVLEIGEVKSLLDLNVADKRNIIDKICGFTIYNNVNKIIKEDAKSLDEKILTNSTIIKSKVSSLDQYERQIGDLKNSSVSQEELDELVVKLREANEIKKANDALLEKINTTKEKIRNENLEKSGEYRDLNNRINEINRKIGLIDSGRCPTCGSSLETEDFAKEKEELLKEKEECENRINNIIKLVNDAKSKISKLDKKGQEIQQSSNNSQVINLMSELKYKKSLMNISVTPIEELKKNLVDEINDLNDEKHKLEEEKKDLEFLIHMFSDNGIKRYISNMYIPMINKLMVEMMEYMNLNYTVIFDNNFDAKIIQNGNNVKYNTLSKGEKRRVDFAAVIAFIRFLKLQFSHVNLLFLDEIFSNVDVNGVNDMIEILKELSVKMNLNIYLIHHAKLEGVLFDKVYQTHKVDGFSRLEII